MREKYKKKRLAALFLCLWMTVVLPVTALAEEEKSSAQAETVSSSGASDVSETVSLSGASDTPETVSSSETANTPEIPAADTGISDEDKNNQLGGDTLRVEEYELFRPESSNNALDTLNKGRSGRLMITVQSDTLMTGDVKASEIIVTKERDSYRTTGSPVVKIASKKGENLTFKVIFPKITYNGRDTVFGFLVKYKGVAMEPIPLSVDITEADETDSSGGSWDDGGSDAAPQPIVRVERSGVRQPVGAGESTTVTLRLTNTSKSSDIEDLLVSFTPGESIYLTDDTNSRLIKRLNTGKSTEIQLNIQAGQDLSGASQNVDVEMKYNYYSENRLTSGTSTQKIIIPVKGNSASGQPLLRIDRVGGGTVRAGEQFQTVIRLENTSQNKDVTGLTVTLEPTEHISLMDATDTRLIGDLKAGASVDIPVNLQAAAELSESASQLVGVSLKFDYDSGKGAAQGTLSSKVVIPTVGGAAKIGSPTPNIIIRNYTYGEIVEAGQVFDLVMEVTNTSNTMPVENVLMSLDTGEGISINDSSNTIYIPSMAPGAVEKKTVRVQALFQSKLQSPKIGITFKYEFLDKKERKQNSTSESIAIPVYQPDRLEVKPPVFVDAVRENEETVISVPYSNKGRGQIFNVEAKLVGDMEVLERELTLGNFESGKNGSIDFVATPRKQGKFEGQVRIVYEDEAMKKKEVTVPVSFEVLAAQMPEEEVMGDTEPETGKRLPMKALTAGALILLGGAVLIIRKKRKKCGQQNLIETGSGEPWEDFEDEE